MTWPVQRLAAPDPQNYSPRQQEIHNEIATGPRGGVRGPLAVWLHRPELAANAHALGQYCRYDSSLEPSLSELAILVAGRVFGSEYEWKIHKGHALKAGLDPDLIETIRKNGRPQFESIEQEIVHDFARAAFESRNVSDALYTRAVEVLGESRVVDLVGLIGYYSLISLTINIFAIPPLDGSEPELRDE